MAFPKGHKKVGGKTKGTPNKATAEIKEAYKNLIENNLDKLSTWLDKVAEKSPERALGILIELSEFVIPKLARTETKHEGDLTVTTITVKRERSSSNT